MHDQFTRHVCRQPVPSLINRQVQPACGLVRPTCREAVGRRYRWSHPTKGVDSRTCLLRITQSARWLALFLSVFLVASLELRMAFAQEQIDLLEKQKQAAAAIAQLSMRVRVTQITPEAKEFFIDWRRGGEGLGGSVVKGRFAPEGEPVPDIDSKLKVTTAGTIAVNQWSAWVPVETVCGRAKGFEFPSVTVAYPLQGKKQPDPPESIAVEFEFAERGKTFHRFVETAPRGATAGFVFPAKLLDQRGAKNPEFVAALQGLSGHARARRERLEQLFQEPAQPPKLFGLIGHLGGYGQAPGGGLGKASGYGVRHNNPEIVKDECRTLQLLGVNGLVDEKSLRMVELAGVADGFKHVYWGGPGSGSPMAAVSSSTAGEPDGCPFDPKLKTTMSESVAKAIAQHEASGAKDKWGLWWDEIGVAAKAHVNDCPRCRDQFREYLKKHALNPSDVGAKDWDAVAPYPIWAIENSGSKAKQSLVAPPDDAASRLRYYYTYRFMSFSTGNLFPESAKQLKEHGIWMYAMQGPTPSWNGSSLDWHEFYDTGANTALVFETSNRDARSWQWESYLSDIMRGISQRHGGMPMGCLVKPHRGAPSQRMLSVVSRGVRALEWYTYGPDYSKGDSFSQSPELLEEVARAGRFLAKAEPYLWNAKYMTEPEVAFVFPRSSEIWGRVGPLGATALENAKWVYLALRHEHIPVDILSEQQLAEGIPARFKALYVIGPNLRRDATAKVAEWVRAGGTLWTDAGGLSRDESDQANVVGNELLKVGARKVEVWGKCPEYRATTLEPLSEPSVPESSSIALTLLPFAPRMNGLKVNETRRENLGAEKPDADALSRSERRLTRAYIAREALSGDGATVLASFADKQAAAIERQVGKGRVVVVGLWAGLSYSAQVRRPDFNMQTDFDPSQRLLVTHAALSAKAARPAVTSNAQVESVALKNEHGQCIALTNWSYIADRTHPRGERHQAIENLRVQLPPGSTAKAVRSLQLQQELLVTDGVVTLPKMSEIDVLVLQP